jgi:hypothetical protein
VSDKEIVVKPTDTKNEVKFGWCKTGYHTLCLKMSSTHTCACDCHKEETS